MLSVGEKELCDRSDLLSNGQQHANEPIQRTCLLRVNLHLKN